MNIFFKMILNSLFQTDPTIWFFQPKTGQNFDQKKYMNNINFPKLKKKSKGNNWSSRLARIKMGFEVYRVGSILKIKGR